MPSRILDRCDKLKSKRGWSLHIKDCITLRIIFLFALEKYRYRDIHREGYTIPVMGLVCTISSTPLTDVNIRENQSHRLVIS